MDKHNKAASSEKPIAENKLNPNKSVTHFNWFARFDCPQTPKTKQQNAEILVG